VTFGKRLAFCMSSGTEIPGCSGMAVESVREDADGQSLF